MPVPDAGDTSLDNEFPNGTCLASHPDHTDILPRSETSALSQTDADQPPCSYGPSHFPLIRPSYRASASTRFAKVYISALASTSIWSPATNSPLRIRLASGFSICCWISRFSGRAP